MFLWQLKFNNFLFISHTHKYTNITHFRYFPSHICTVENAFEAFSTLLHKTNKKKHYTTLTQKNHGMEHGKFFILLFIFSPFVFIFFCCYFFCFLVVVSRNINHLRNILYFFHFNFYTEAFGTKFQLLFNFSLLSFPDYKRNLKLLLGFMQFILYYVLCFFLFFFMYIDF